MVSNNQLIVSYVKPGDKRVWTGIGFFAEPDATVNVFLDIDNLHNNRNAVYGSPLNDRMAAQRKKEDEITKPVLALRKASNNPDLSEQERKKAEREAKAAAKAARAAEFAKKAEAEAAKAAAEAEAAAVVAEGEAEEAVEEAVAAEVAENAAE